MWCKRNLLVHAVLLLHHAVLLFSLTDGDLRLNGIGSSDLIGRLEVFYQGGWREVCGGDFLPFIQFNIHSSHVACGQMGLGFAVDYYSPIHLPEHRYQYGVGTGPKYLMHSGCSDSSQSHLLQCTRGRIEEVNGTFTKDVVLQCSNVSSYYNGEIRLTPDPVTPTSERASSSGFLELYSNGEWRGVCLDENDIVDTPTAQALCRQLGYTRAEIAENVGTVSDYHASSSWMLPSALSCSESDVCIKSCLVGDLPVVARETPCRPVHLSCVFNDISVLPQFGTRQTCSASATPIHEGDLRLFPQPSEVSIQLQRLDVFKDGAWGSVCGRGSEISYQEGDVICKQLGYPAAVEVGHVSGDMGFGVPLIPQGSGLVYNLRCTGIENHVTECDLSLSEDCTHGYDTTIKCSAVSTPYGSLSIRGRANSVSGASGTLLLYDGIMFHPVCDHDFTREHAEVACRQMGYSSGTPAYINNSYFGFQSTTNALIDLVRLTGSCSGSESQILSCPPGAEDYRLQGFLMVEEGTSDTCRQGLDEVAVQCVSNNQHRLVGGARPNAGRLEVNYAGEWRRVCGIGFGRSEALVVCRNIGYQSVTSLEIDGRYGVGEGPINFNDVVCSGFESSLFQCRFSFDAVTSCVTPGNIDIAIECGADPLPLDGEVRLVGGDSDPSDLLGGVTNSSHPVGGVFNSSDQSSGRLEVSLNGEWLSVCGLLFSEMAAEVACRQLGYMTMVGYCTDACFGEGSGEVLFMEDHCIGDEDRLVACPWERRHPQGCNHDSDVGLTCEGLIVITTTTTPTSGDDPLPPHIYYIIAGCVGGVLIIIVMVMVVCCTCCCLRRKKKTRGLWRTNTRGQSGHHHHHEVVVDASQLAKEKEGGFDDPKDIIEMNPSSSPPSVIPLGPSSSSSPLTNGYESSHVTPQHDVILHALSHNLPGTGGVESYIAPTMKAKGHQDYRQGNNGYHHHQNGNGVVENRGVVGIVVVSNGTAASGSIPSCPPPDYRELFRTSVVMEAMPTGHHVTNGHAGGTWYEGSASSESEDEKQKR